MTDPWECVVLPEDRDERTAGAGLGDEGGLETAGPAFDGDLFRLQIVRERGGREALLEGELGPRVDVQCEAVERVCTGVDTLGDALLTRRGVQGLVRLPRTRCGTRGENELGQGEAGDDEPARDEAQPVDGAEQTERRNERADLDPAADRGGALRGAATRAR